jgi:transcriptional regulator GlxA family with amidase domain
MAGSTSYPCLQSSADAALSWNDARAPLVEAHCKPAGHSPQAPFAALTRSRWRRLSWSFAMKHLALAMCSLLLALVAGHAPAASLKIGIVVFDGFLTSDVTAPVEVFGAATKKSWFSSYQVMLISATRNTSVVSEEGLRVVADKSIYDKMKVDVLLVPSSYDMDPLIRNKDLIDFIRKQARTAAWVGSNCSGAFLLGEAGLLDNKRATTWAGGEKELANRYPKVKVQYDQNVVVDAGVITSNGGPVSYQAALELLSKLSSESLASEIATAIQFPRLQQAFEQPRPSRQ